MVRIRTELNAVSDEAFHTGRYIAGGDGVGWGWVKGI